MSQTRIRMYRPGGIGDCFLVSFQDGQGPHMLIDCGVLKGTPGGAEGLIKAIQNVRAVTNNKLDYLVISHEHWDHVSGFFQAQEEFKQLTIGAVWLAWTEKRGNPLADHLREEHEKAKQAVAKACLKLGSGLQRLGLQGSESLENLEKLSLFYAPQDPASLGMAAAGAEAVGYSPADAMAWASQKTGGAVSYLKPEMDAIPIPGVEGIRVFVLGPPQSEELIKKDKPSKKKPEVYSLAAGNNLGFMAAVEAQSSDEDGSRPFHISFEIKVDAARQEGFFKQTYFNAKEYWRNIELDWLASAERLALQLDSDTNNTSLALAIELGDKGKVLVFPGDAQVGNWISWQGRSWNATNARGEPEQVKVEDLLGRTVLYKVGHHASHNATTMWGLEAMDGEGLAALIPVYEEQAHSQGKKGWDMPFPPLLKRLMEKTEGRVFRADLGAPPGPVMTRYEVQEGWVDLWVVQ